jgi:1,4-dihydroxy-6-naphthoate synthase
MKIAYSPCPNDTYIFDGWVHGKIPSSIKPEPILADIQQLNLWACSGRYPVTKVSTYTLGKITGHYTMLRAGAAICGAGPKLISKHPFTLSELGEKRVAVPGLDTTAYLLFCALCPKPKSVLVCRYDEITKMLESGACDAGLIIHETRFTFAQSGLRELADLGLLFFERFQLPLPLGVIVAKKELAKSQRLEIEESIAASISYANANPSSSQEYILRTSQEKEVAVVQKHIKTFVTDETLRVSNQGCQAIKTLFELGIQNNLLSQESLSFHEIDHLCHI